MLDLKKISAQVGLFDSPEASNDYMNEQLKRMRKEEVDLKIREAEEDYSSTYNLDDKEKFEYFNEKNEKKMKKIREDIKILSNNIDNSIDYHINGIDLSKEQILAFNIMEYSMDNLFFNSCGGTGKSELLKFFAKNTTKNVVVLGSTGKSALNIAGQTIHSFFQLQPRVYLDDEKISVSKELRMIIRNLDTIIIDEVSMVPTDIMDCIDKICRQVRGNACIFGGIQVILFGDLYQLAPVVMKQDIGRYNKKYGGTFFFELPFIKKYPFIILELSQVFRQKEDNFKAILNRLRTNQLTQEDLVTLNKRVIAYPVEEDIIYLSSTKEKAATINIEKLNSIKEEEFVYTSKYKGEVNIKNCVEKYLHLKKGARVMLLTNDKEKRWFNGTIAKVVELD